MPDIIARRNGDRCRPTASPARHGTPACARKNSSGLHVPDRQASAGTRRPCTQAPDIAMGHDLHARRPKHRRALRTRRGRGHSSRCRLDSAMRTANITGTIRWLTTSLATLAMSAVHRRPATPSMRTTSTRSARRARVADRDTWPSETRENPTGPMSSVNGRAAQARPRAAAGSWQPTSPPILTANLRYTADRRLRERRAISPARHPQHRSNTEPAGSFFCSGRGGGVGQRSSGKSEPNIGSPLTEFLRETSSSMMSQCSLRRPPSIRTKSAAIHGAGWP